MAVGFNFRDSIPYKAGPAGTVEVSDNDNYPTTRDGHTFGRQDELYGRNRNSTIDGRFSGQWSPLGATRVSHFRYDLAGGAGTYPIRLALGDYEFAASTAGRVRVLDGVGGPVRLDVTMPVLDRQEFIDSTGTIYTAATWPSSAATDNLEFASGVLIVELGDSTATDTSDSRIAHLEVGDAIASGPTLDTVPATAYLGQSRTVAVTGAGATQGTGGVTIGGVAQTITAWSDTSITFTTVQGNNKYATGKTIELTTDGGQAASGTIDLIVEPGTGGFVDVVSPETTDTSAFAYQAETAGGDPVATGDQFEWRYTGNVGDPTSMTVQVDTLPSELDAEGDVEGRFWDATDSAWGSWYTFTAAVESSPAPGNSGIRFVIKSVQKSNIKQPIKV